uniref:Putative ovule protein n=1 Tax=Solanum chacoense TaxID=4108 RepID=A0A0V0IV33_SOLCH
MKSVGSRSEPVIGLHGGALLGVAYRTSRRVSAAAATAISTIQSMPLSGYGGSSVSSFSTMEDGSQKSAAEAAPQNFQLYSWETFQPVGGLLPQPDWTAWDQTVEYCAFGYPQHIVICSLRPQFRYLGDVAIPFATGAVWQRRQLFVATPTTVECVFVDAGVAPIDIETKRRKEEMKLKEAQSRGITEHGELALITVDNQQSNPQERIALRPPMLQVVRLASFQHAPSIPPFLSLPRQSKVDGDASSVLKEMEARKANEVAVGGGGVAVAVTRFPAEQTRPVGPLVIVGVRDGVLWLIDRYMCAHAISLSHPGIRCRCLAAYGDAVSAVKWASRLGREHHDDLAQFMLGMGYATEALHLPGISKRLEFDLALQSNDLKRALQCLLTMSNSRDIGQETVGLDLNDLMNMTKKKENVVEAVQGVVKFAKEFMELIDAADATAQADIAREALKRLAAAGSIKGALRGQELRGVALRLANHGELTRLSNLVNNLISVGAGREAAFAAALLGDNVLMEKAWQETGMLAEAVLHAHAHGRPSMRTLVQSWNKMLQKEMEHTPSMKTDAAAAFLASLEGPKLTSLADAAKKPPIEILPPGMASLYGPNPGQAKPLLGKPGLPQPGKPLLLEGSKTTAPMASVPAGSNTSATSESGVPPKSENGASTTPESGNPPASDSGAAPAADSGAAPASETGAAPPTETGAAPPATETGATPPVIESGAAPATETGATPAESSTTQTSNLDSSVAADAIVPATPALNESDYLALVPSTSAPVEPTTIGAIVPSTSATGPPPVTDNKKPSVPDERLMIDFS